MKRLSVRVLLVLFIILCLTEGCGQEPVRNRSGGIVSDEPQWTPRYSWFVSEEPELILGRWEEGAETFDQVRTAVRFSRDRIAVADGATVSVRVFDLSGRMVLEIGREGTGPGEFRRVNHVSAWKDTIRVGDGSLGRVTYFNLDGEYLDSFELPRDLAGFSTEFLAFYSNGDVLFQGRMVSPSSDLVPRPGLLPADSVTWFRFSPESRAATHIATTVSMEVYGHPWKGNTVKGEAIFGSRGHAALYQDTLLLARGGDHFEVDMIEEGGEVVDWFGLKITPRPPSAGDRKQYVEWRLANAPVNANMADWERVFRDAPMREVMPATGELVVDRGGNTWVQHFSPPGLLSVWSVFDRSHRWLGNVEVPAETRILEIGTDYLLAVWRNELKVETVVLLTLVKP